MKSRTSFFNTAVLKKDITRFAPAWGLYLTGMLLLTMTIFMEEDAELARSIGTTLGLFSLINICYALVCGALLFGDLFNSKLCNALHAMPMRREGWFLTHVTSGLLFSIVPNLLVCLILMPRLGEYWYVAFIWLGGMTLTYLFFFGAAVLSAMCTGSRFGMTLVYGLINFLSILALWTVGFLYKPLLYGVEINGDSFIFLSPISYLCSHELRFFQLPENSMYYFYRNAINGWPYVAGIAVAGVVMLVCALVLYRKRHLESAGDLITVRFLSPVFLILYALTAGMALFLFSYIFSADRDYLFLAVGIVIGFITGRMLLMRTIKVFKPSTFIGMAVMLAVLFGSIGIVKSDVLNVIFWTPEPENIRTVSIHYASDTHPYTTSKQSEIRELVELHSGILDQQVEDDSWRTQVYLTYTMYDGSVITRLYPVDYAAEEGETLARMLSRPEYVLQTDDVENFVNNVNYIEVEYYFDKFYGDTSMESFKLVTGAEARELMDAIIADCQSERMNQDYNYYNIHSDETAPIGFVRINVAGSGDLTLNIWQESIQTCNWLQNHLAQ